MLFIFDATPSKTKWPFFPDPPAEALGTHCSLAHQATSCIHSHVYKNKSFHTEKELLGSFGQGAQRLK